jgi:hypothetical protein
LQIFIDRILSLKEGGILQIFKQKHWPNTDKCQGSVVTEAKEIELVDVQAAFIVIGVGIMFGIIVLFFEKVFKQISDNFCTKKPHSDCECVGTIPTRDI